ncbi:MULTISPECIES: peptidoglycan-binding protein [unclassified Streptomyces]|uniref:peptidoglycan-binding domain-containing protein n=1 Tax=unclassified Streptomyces TaxID=2593676 RepID=UPI002258C371|nr:MULTISPECIES: peptidoglycan-binding domain-containing protein [unclassified Streptomyces]MCX4871063.1 peptidoglycan-binding protein [Streptomyces sp. NBC_00906]MCX4902708.1 peptidoglycan-binding protein [Streptomyces sp. NBC_00892]
MNRSTLWATLTTTALAIAAFATLGTQAPDTATASSSDPAASAARSADPASRNQQQWPTLRTGSHGDRVTALQQLLTAHGHSLTADGSFGGLTAAAVHAFQKNQGLQADGVAGPATWKALITAPAGARPSTGQTGTGQNATPSPTGYSLKFTKNQKHPMYSALSLVHNGKAVKTYRAGSGMGVTNECASGEGWLPSGTYQVKGHETDRNSGLQTGIKGYAIQLEDKTCTPKAGQQPVKRDALFIHSEMLSDGTQAIDVPLMDDDYYRWDGDIDYKSWGCIKIMPTDIEDLFTRLDRAGWPKNLTLHVS